MDIADNKVVILQYRMLHYRVELFERLKAKCAKGGISLSVVYGGATASESLKNDTSDLGWGEKVRNFSVSIFGRDIVWQPFPKAHRDSTLVVTMQENRILSNYRLIVGQLMRGPKVAFWGHGRNLQSRSPNGLRERWKRISLRSVFWFFAYTESTRGILLADGFRDDRITVLNNAIDNEKFRRELSSVSETQILAAYKSIGLDHNATTGLYCGSLYADKKLDLLIEIADNLRSRIPGFQMIVIGDGPLASVVIQAEASRPWLKRLGATHGADKAIWFKSCDVILNPGAVGLNILDAFCAGKAFFTTRDARHGPEFHYIENGVNGNVCESDSLDFAKCVTDLLGNKFEYDSMCAAALKKAEEFTLDNMVECFYKGIDECIQLINSGKTNG